MENENNILKKRSKSLDPFSKTQITNNNNNINNNNANQINLISNEPLFSYKSTHICIFCGGKSCKHENFKNHPNPAIYGLNSDKIDDNIYASQRPANSLIKQFNLISKFKELNIGFIVNLQLQGEHPFCGPIDKLDESGFSYSPSLFESEGIHVGLYGWKDMNIPNSLNHMLQIVKTMHYYIHYLKKKVLVHCHAGYGRTGITIACYKIFDESISAEVAKNEIRKIRPKCIQSKDQLLYCINFQEFIRRLKGNFYLKEKRIIENFIKYQNDLNVGEYKFLNFEYNKSVPLFLIYIFDSIIDIKNKFNLDEVSLYKCLNCSITSEENNKELLEVMKENINKYNWDILYSCEDPIILCQLLYQWLTNSIINVIDPQNIKNIQNNFTDFNEILKLCEYQTILMIVKFLSLIKSSGTPADAEVGTEVEKKNFLKKISNYLLGYCNDDEEKLKEEEIANVIKLCDLILFLEKNEINTNDKDEKGDKEDNKEFILSNIYKQLKDYYENKKGYTTNNNHQQINSENIFQSINLIMNNNNTLKTSMGNEENKIKEMMINKNMTINLHFSIENINLNNSLKLSHTMKIKQTIKNELQNKKIEEENEEDEIIPWIREEDC